VLLSASLRSADFDFIFNFPCWALAPLGLPASSRLMSKVGIRQILMYYLSRSPRPTPTSPWDISPRSRQDSSRDLLGLLPPPLPAYVSNFGGQTLRRFSFPHFSKSSGGDGRKTREKAGKEIGWLTKSVTLWPEVTQPVKIINFNFGHLSLSFGSQLYPVPSLCRKTPFIKLRLGKLGNKEYGRKKMLVPKSIPTLGEYLKKFGLIFLSQLIWDILLRKVIIIQINSERYGCSLFL